MKTRLISLIVAAAAVVHASAFDLSVAVVPPVGKPILPAVVKLGDNIQYRLAVVNTGSNTVSGAALIDWVDPGCQVVRVQSGTAYSVINNQIAISLPDLPVDGFWFVTITVKPSRVGRFTDYLVVSKDVQDENPENDVASVQTDVTTGAGLAVATSQSGVLVTVTNAAGQQCVVERSTNLADWTPMFTNYGLTGFQFSVAPTNAAGFYRVKEQ